MHAPLVGQVDAIAAGRRADQRAVGIDGEHLGEGCAQRGPDGFAGVGEIQHRARRGIGVMAEIGTEIEEGDRCRDALEDAGMRRGQHPNVAQAVILRVVIAERVAKDRDQRDVAGFRGVAQVFSGWGARRFAGIRRRGVRRAGARRRREDGEDLGSAADRLDLDPQACGPPVHCGALLGARAVICCKS